MSMLQQTIRNACDFISSLEEQIPLASYSGAFDTWAECVREAWVTGGGGAADASEDEELLENALEARRMFHEAAFLSVRQAEAPATKDWSWLLEYPQVEQRTAAWYAESRELLTASELGDLWKGPGTRNALVRRKCAPPPPESVNPPPAPVLCVPRSETSAMLWGQRYEPVVKQLLERRTGSRILELGRIRHRTIPKLAASPDGLFLDGDRAGRLVEIKCPPTRAIKEDTIPHGYWCQMQLQMEVCDRPVCEYVEVKFVEGPLPDTQLTEAIATGWITLLTHADTFENRYAYHDTLEERPEPELPWVAGETYEWTCVRIREVTVLRDRQWFEETARPAIAAFWTDVGACLSGTWQAPAIRTRKPRAAAEPAEAERRCAILDAEGEVDPSSPVLEIAVVREPCEAP